MADESTVYHVGMTCGHEYAGEHAPYFVTPFTLGLVNQILEWMELFGGPLKRAEEVRVYNSSTYFIANPGLEDLSEDEDIPAMGTDSGGSPMVPMKLSELNECPVLVDRLPPTVVEGLDSSEFEGGLNVRTECDYLCVQSDRAYWTGIVKHTDINVESQGITRKELITLRDRLATMETLRGAP